LGGGELVRALAEGVGAEELEDFGFGGGEADVVLNAEEDGAGSAALFDDQGTALALDTIEKLAEMGAGAEGGNGERGDLARGLGHVRSLHFRQVKCTVKF